MAKTPHRDRVGTNSNANYPPVQRRKNHLFLIGIDAYQQVGRLSNAVRDAQAVRDLLMDKYTFSQDQLTELYDKQATRRKIMSGLREMIQSVKPEDNLLVYFSGHGHYDKAIDEAYWVPVDAEYTDIDDYVSYSFLTKIIKAIQAHHIVFIVDSCYSGAALVRERDLKAERFERDPSRWLIASGRNEVVPDGVSGGHSPFADKLLDILDRYANDGIRIGTLADKLTTSVTHNSYQTPIGRPLFQVGDQGGEFVFYPREVVDTEPQDWTKAIQANSLAAFRHYLQQHPKGEHAEEAYWRIAQLKDDKTSYRAYIRQYDSGRWFDQAVDGLEKCEERDQFQHAKKRGEAALIRFRQKFPNGTYAEEARKEIEQIQQKEQEHQARQAAIQGGEVEVKAYIERFPEGPYAAEAGNKLQQIRQEAERIQAEKARKEQLKREQAEAAAKAEEASQAQARKEAEARKKRERELADLLAQASQAEQANELPKAARLLSEAYQLAPKSQQANIQQRIDRLKQGIKQAKRQESKEISGIVASVYSYFLQKNALRIGSIVFVLLAVIVGITYFLPQDETETPVRAQTQTLTNQASAQTSQDLPDGFVLIEGGSFQMGDQFGDGNDDETPVHRVSVSSFLLATHELTFEEYDRFCEATGRSKPDDQGWGRGRRPVINLSWYDAIEYCNWRSQQEGLRPFYTIDKRTQDPNNTNSSDDLKWLVRPNEDANGYRLPTEAEWEYAAREGGRKVRFANGQDIADPAQMNFDGSDYAKASYSKVGSYRRQTVEVGSFSPNSLNLHDMSGNVWEWCWDWYESDYYEQRISQDPKGPADGQYRVLRGGSWIDDPDDCRAALRIRDLPDLRFYIIGVRLARHTYP